MKRIKSYRGKVNVLLERKGVKSTLIYLLRKSISETFFIRIPAVFFALTVAALHFFIKIRLVKLYSDRIGHYALNTELLLCTLDAVFDPKIKYLFYTCDSSVPICNAQLDKMWRRIVRVIPFPSIAYRTDCFLSLILRESYSQDPIKRVFEAGSGDKDIYGLLEKNSKPHLTFTKSEQINGQLQLERLGIPRDAQYVCLIIRDAKYLQTQFPDTDWSYQEYRDADIISYSKAAQFLANKGYYVIRMGKYVGKAFDIVHPRIIDYANSSFRSDFMDIYLLSRCYFYVSTSTGLDAIPQIFRKPGVFTNIVLPIEFPTWHPCLLFIPKKMREVTSKKILSFKEIYRYFEKLQRINSWTLKENNLELIENLPEEILSVIQEMELRLTGKWKETERDMQLQKNFWDDFPSDLKSERGTYRFSKKISIKIGSDFLNESSSLAMDLSQIS